MYDPTGSFTGGGVWGMGLTGLVTGLLPLLVGLFRGSAILGRAGFLVSFLAGAFGGPFAGVAVAVLASVGIVVLTIKRETPAAAYGEIGPEPAAPASRRRRRPARTWSFRPGPPRRPCRRCTPAASPFAATAAASTAGMGRPPHPGASSAAPT
jgi:hypothetical protein